MKRLIQGLTALGLLGTPAVAAADPGDIVGIEIASVDLDDDMVGDNIYGYWEYLPTAYDTVGEPWPMFIFLSGIGENGNGLLPPGGCSGPGNPGSYLCRNLRHGPQSHIWDQLYGPGALNEWDEEERPFIVISPQNPAPPLVFGNPYDSDDMNEFLDYLIEAYNVDPRRIYLTGMSMGGYSVALSLVDHPGRYAAASMLPGIGVTGSDPCNVGRTALWSFHGDLDQAGSGAFDPGPLTTWMASVRDCPEPHPDVELTMYVNAGHNVWSRTIDPLQGQDDPVYEEFPYQGGMLFDTIPYEPDIYTWLLQYDLPEVSAGPDFEVTTDDDSFEILAFITDDDPVEFTWTQTAGDPLTLTDADTQTLTVSDLVEGEYTFNVFALDADDQYDSDEVTITIVPGMGGGSESESEGSSSSSTGGDGSSSTGGFGSSSTGGGDAGLSTSTGGDDTTTGATSTGSGSPSGSGSASDSDSDSDPSAGSASDSASGGSASDSNSGSATATAGDSDGADTDGDSNGGGASSDSGGCTVGGSPAPSLWMLGLFGFVAVRRRR